MSDPKRILTCESAHYLPADQLAGLAVLEHPRTITPGARARLRSSLLSLSVFKGFLVWKDEAGRPTVIAGTRRHGVLVELLSEGFTLWLRRTAEDGTPGAEEVPAPGVPITWFHGTRSQAMLVAARDNAHDGEWDWAQLGGWLGEIQQADPEVDLTLTGFSGDEIGDFMSLGAGDLLLTTIARGDAARDVGDEGDEGGKGKGKGKGKNRLPDSGGRRGEVFQVGPLRSRISAATAKLLRDALARVALPGDEGMDDPLRRLLSSLETGTPPQKG